MDFENSRDNSILFAKFKIKFADKTTSSKGRNTMTTKMKFENRVMTVTNMRTSFRITTKKKGIKNIMPGDKRKRRNGIIESGIEGSKTGITMGRIEKKNFDTSGAE